MYREGKIYRAIIVAILFSGSMWLLLEYAGRGDEVTKGYASSYTQRDGLVTEIEEMAGDENRNFLYYLHTLIYVESSYNPHAVSTQGAVGLMQMTSLAAQDAAAYCRIPVPTKEVLAYYRTNILYGTCYLHLLLDIYGGDWYTTLAAYHGGNAAANLLREGKTIGKNTANYITKIMYLLRSSGTGTRYNGPGR